MPFQRSMLRTKAYTLRLSLYDIPAKKSSQYQIYILLEKINGTIQDK